MENMFKIIGGEGKFPEFQLFHQLGSKFLPYAHKKLGFNKPVEVNLLSDPENAKNPLGKTGYYDPNQMKITLFVDKRHVKDILRSMAHELVHHTQNCRGEFAGGANTKPGYAQEDGHMRKMEEEAYLEGQMLLRDWEDGVKREKQKMSLKENIKIVINEAKPGDIVPSRGAQSWLDKQMAKLGKEKEEEREEEEEERRVSKALNDPGLELARQHAREQEGFFDLEENKTMAKREKINQVTEDTGLRRSRPLEGGGPGSIPMPKVRGATPEERAAMGPGPFSEPEEEMEFPEDTIVYNPEADEWGIESEEEQMSLPMSADEGAALRRYDEEMLEEEDSEESYIYNPEADEWGIESEKEQMSLPLSTREMELDPDPVHAVPPPRPRKRGEPAAYAENWFKGNKDQLLFETLMKKWAK